MSRRLRLGAFLALSLAAACGQGVESQPEPTQGKASTVEAASPLPAPPGSLPFARATLWSPDREQEAALDPYLAPLLYLEAPEYSSDSSDSNGSAVGASGLGTPRWNGEAGDVEVDLGAPVLFFEESSLEHADREHRQLRFFWFRLDVEGRPRAQGVRTTFATDGWPAVIEVLADPSGERGVYLTESQEEAALEHFGAPLPDQVHASVEGEVPGRRLVEVIGTGAMPMGPFVYETLRADGVPLVHCRCSPSQVNEVLGTEIYALRPLEELGAALGSFDLDFGPPEAALEGLRLPPGF